MSPLGERFRMLKAKEADILVQNKALYENKEQLSQQEYIRGISAWNFNLEDLKNQAAAIQDDAFSNSEDPRVSGKLLDRHNDVCFLVEKKSSPEQANHSNIDSQLEDELNDIHDLENSLIAFPSKPLQALKGCFDVCEDDIGAGSPSSRDFARSDSELQIQQQPSTGTEQESGRIDGYDVGRSGSVRHSFNAGPKKYLSGSLLQDYVSSPKKLTVNGDREYLQPRYPSEQNYSGPLHCRQKKDVSNSVTEQEASEGAVVERKGRFKVTSADLSPKGPINSNNPHFGASSSQIVPSVTAASVLTSLQGILLQNTMQREEIISKPRLMLLRTRRLE